MSHPTKETGEDREYRCTACGGVFDEMDVTTVAGPYHCGPCVPVDSPAPAAGGETPEGSPVRCFDLTVGEFTRDDLILRGLSPAAADELVAFAERIAAKPRRHAMRVVDAAAAPASGGPGVGREIDDDFGRRLGALLDQYEGAVLTFAKARTIASEVNAANAREAVVSFMESLRSPAGPPRETGESLEAIRNLARAAGMLHAVIDGYFASNPPDAIAPEWRELFAALVASDRFTLASRAPGPPRETGSGCPRCGAVEDEHNTGDCL